MLAKRILTSCAAMLVLVLFSACDRTQGEPRNIAEGIALTGAPRTTLCHYVGLKSLPYVEINVSAGSSSGHQQHPYDILPAPPQGCPTAVEQAAGTIPGIAEQPPAELAEGVDPQCNSAEAVRGVLEQYGNLSQFRGLIERAGWLDEVVALPVTLFVPTDDAFAQAADLVAERTQDKASLNALLLYHTVLGAWDSAQLATGSSLMTITGEPIGLAQPDGRLVLNEQVHLITPDIRACDDIIHLIDGVLFAPAAPESVAGLDGVPLSLSAGDGSPTGGLSSTGSLATASPLPPGIQSAPNSALQPTVQPTTVVQPTPIPTDPPPPTARPTSAPQPTSVPTSAPQPTSAPTSAPQPTSAPTSVPQPTSAPTSAPQPTSAPTDAPTDPPQPTDAPTDPPQPTDDPTPLPPPPEETFTVCHNPNGKSPRTITVSASDLDGHLGHGDTMGACP